MVTKTELAGIPSAALQLSSAYQSGDVAGMISGTVGVLAAIPGPMQTGFGISATVLATMTALDHAQQGTLSPADVAGVAAAALGVLAASASAGLIPASVAQQAAAGVVAGAYSYLGTEQFYDFMGLLRDKIAPTTFGKMIGHLIDALGDLNPEICDLFTRAKNFIFPKDPLALDLDGDGIETIGVTATTQVLFDFDADGIKTGTGWVKSDDALLVLDKNANGTIDNGNELFGVDTVLVNGPNAGQTAVNGFAALADLDSNHDGQFSSLDTQYANVQIWRDLNQDGISQAGELQSLAQAGIASINLNSTATNIALSGGNVQSAAGSFTRSNGSTGTVGDFMTGSAGNLDLAQNPFYSEFTDHITLTAEAARLPGLQGSGAVRNLQEAASLNTALLADINGLAGLSRSQMVTQIDTLIQHWADSSALQTSQQKAAAQGYALIYKLPGVTSNELQRMAMAGYGLQANVLDTSFPVDPAHFAQIQAEFQSFSQMMGILEKFNGLNFFNFPDDGSLRLSNGTLVNVQSKEVDLGIQTGGASSVSTCRFATPALDATQVLFLQQSYAALKQSVYDGLVMQTRLKGYLDEISLSIDQNGISLDFSAMDAVRIGFEATNDSNWRKSA